MPPQRLPFSPQRAMGPADGIVLPAEVPEPSGENHLQGPAAAALKDQSPSRALGPERGQGPQALLGVDIPPARPLSWPTPAQ